MSRLSCTSTCRVKVNRKTYRPTTPFGYGILLPPAPPAPPLAAITPSQLAADIKSLLALSQELGRRQHALVSKVRGMVPLPPIAGGAPQDHSDADLEEMYLSVQWLDRLDAMHRDPADQLL